MEFGAISKVRGGCLLASLDLPLRLFHINHFHADSARIDHAKIYTKNEKWLSLNKISINKYITFHKKSNSIP